MLISIPFNDHLQFFSPSFKKTGVALKKACNQIQIFKFLEINLRSRYRKSPKKITSPKAS